MRGALQLRRDLLPRGVKGDVVRRRVQCLRVVLELPEAAVAVETQECSHRAGRMIMVDVRGGRGLQIAQSPP